MSVTRDRNEQIVDQKSQMCDSCAHNRSACDGLRGLCGRQKYIQRNFEARLEEETSQSGQEEVQKAQSYSGAHHFSDGGLRSRRVWTAMSGLCSCLNSFILYMGLQNQHRVAEHYIHHHHHHYNGLFCLNYAINNIL